LQAIEKQVQRASELDDIRALRTDLGTCLLALREAVAHQRNSSIATVERLQGHITMTRKQASAVHNHACLTLSDIELIPESADDPIHPVPTSYVAAFKLQRAEHIASRFGEHVKHEMLSMIGTQLKTILGPSDRLLRWKQTSFVMFISAAAAIREIRSRLAETVAAIGQQYIEVGTKSALLSVGVDWIVFPQSDRPSLEAVFDEIDVFLANTAPEPSAPVRTQRRSEG
jgi:GGDEF domain-containing protein